MTGKYDVVIENLKVKYEFTVKRKYTKIQGDSATGKTVMVSMIREPYTKIKCDVDIIAPLPLTWKDDIKDVHNKIIVFDEDCSGIGSREFYKILRDSDNYFILITRNKLSDFPYSIDEIYLLKAETRYNALNKAYTLNTFINCIKHNTDTFYKSTIMTEDSNFGYTFFKKSLPECTVLPGNGKDNLLGELQRASRIYNEFTLIVDGVGYGSAIDDMLDWISSNRYNKTIHLVMPESFEYLLLYAVLPNNYKYLLTKTYDYCNKESWEKFYTAVLAEYGNRNHRLAYSKSELNDTYLSYKDYVLKMLFKSPYLEHSNLF